MATAQPQAPTDLALYGGRDEVKELGARLQNYMPNAQQFTNVEAQAVAQIAVAHGLDPFNGEVWGIKGDGKWYGVMVGIKGLRKCAHRQADLEGGHYWIEITYANPKDYGEPESSVVAVCVLRDTRSMKAYAESLRALRDCGMPYEDAKAELGVTPRIMGVGIATVSERSKMKINQRAMKRAEADAIKKRFDVSFGVGVYSENDKEVLELAQHAISTDEADGYQDGYVEEVEEVQATPEPNLSNVAKATITAKQNASRFDPANSIDDLFPAEKPSEQRIQEMKKESKAAPRPMDTPEKIAWTNEQISFITTNGYAASNFGATGMLDLSCLKADATEAEIDRWCKLYREIRPLVPLSDSPKAPEAAQKANEKYLSS